MQYLEFASNGTLHGMLKAYLFELERKNNIAEKQLELQREIFEFNKELDQRNTVANENVVATTQKVLDEELDEEIDALSTTPLVKTKLTRGLRAKSGVIDDSIGSAVENGMPAMDIAKINNLPSKETYVSGLHVPSYDFREWSDPIYQCPEDGCDGGMCKNLTTECASLPPMYVYRCNKCGHTDYLSQ